VDLITDLLSKTFNWLFVTFNNVILEIMVVLMRHAFPFPQLNDEAKIFFQTNKMKIEQKSLASDFLSES